MYRGELRFILWDFDGTIVETHMENNFSLEKALPLKKNIKQLKQQVKEGLKIFIFTSRGWEDYKDVKDWLVRHKIPFKGIIMGKPLAREMWDDRAINPNCGECVERGKVN